MKIEEIAMRIVNFRAHHVNESLRNIVIPYNIWNFVKKMTELIKEMGTEE